MRTECLLIKALLASIVPAAGGLGCSDSGTQPSDGDGSGGVPFSPTGGSAPVVTGGAPVMGVHAGTGGVGNTGGTSTAGGALGIGGKASDSGGGGSGGATGVINPAGGTNAGAAGKGGSVGTAGGGSGGRASPNSAGASGKGGSGGAVGGSCTASKSTGKSVSGTGPHKVVIETNSEAGIKCGTIFRPEDLGGTEKYPILVWGEGGCSQNGLSNQAAMGEIASWGYFVVADGTPGGTNACTGGQNGRAFLEYITWAIAENNKPCSAYYQSLETTKIAADGFSCGGLMAENVSGDPRFTAIGITSSGLMGSNDSLYDKIHTPFKIMNGGPSDVAYENGLNDYDEISSRGVPIVYFAKKSAGHGGDLFQGRGDFNLVNLAWLNWQLKGDQGATGKGFLHGSNCRFCTDSDWEYKSANVQ
ncbi:MAG TPA: hypothetical protein VIM73_05545 [Polyangiaceae bacterium]